MPPTSVCLFYPWKCPSSWCSATGRTVHPRGHTEGTTCFQGFTFLPLAASAFQRRDHSKTRKESEANSEFQLLPLEAKFQSHLQVETPNPEISEVKIKGQNWKSLIAKVHPTRNRTLYILNSKVALDCQIYHRFYNSFLRQKKKKK